MRVLILGGDSFVAKSLIPLWRQAAPEDDIFFTSRRPSASKGEVFFEHKNSSLYPLLASIRANLVVNLISYTGDDIVKATNINTNLPREILRCQTDLDFHAVLFGSAAEYGLLRSFGHLKESSTLRPQSSYGVSKAAQSELAEAALFEGAEITYLRAFNIFGHNMHPRLLPGRIQKSVFEAIHVKAPSIDVGRADDVRDFIHLNDLCSTLIKLVNLRSFNILNVASGTGQTVGEFADYFVHEFLGQPALTVNKTHSFAPTFSIADVTKLKGELINE